MPKIEILKLSKWKGAFYYEININIKILDETDFITLFFRHSDYDRYMKHWKYLKEIQND